MTRHGWTVALAALACCVSACDRGEIGRPDAPPAAQADANRPMLRICGTVWNDSGKPAAGATVTVYVHRSLYDDRYDKVVEMSADANGAFFFALLPARAIYCVVARKNALALDWGTAYWGVPQPTVTMNLTLSQAATMSGEVVDESGRPVASAKVRPFVERMPGSATEECPAFTSTGDLPQVVTTDANGLFAFPDFSDRWACEFCVEAEGFELTRTNWDMPGSWALYVPGAEGPRITLRHEIPVHVVAVDGATGKPASGARFRWVARGHSRIEFGDATADDKGAFDLHGIGPRPVEFMSDSEAGSAPWLADPVTVKIKAGESSKQVELRVWSGGALNVLVKGRDTGQPLTHIAVHATGPQRQYFGQALTDEHGRCCLRLLDGNYTIYVHDPAYDNYKNLPKETLRIEEGKTQELTLELSPTPRLRGRAVDPNGAAIPKAEIYIRPAGQPYWSGPWASVAPGSEPYPILAEKDGSFDVAASRSSGDIAILAPSRSLFAVILPASFTDDENLGDVRLEPAATLDVEAVDADHKPIPSASVNLMGSLGPAPQPKRVGEGKFRYECLPLAKAQWMATVAAEGYVVGLIRPSAILKAGHNEITVVLRPANLSISGRVVDADGNAAANITVTANHVDGQSFVHFYDGGRLVGHRYGRTDANGCFTISGLSDLPVDIMAYKNWFAGTVSPTLRAKSGDRDVLLQLRAKVRPATQP